MTGPDHWIDSKDFISEHMDARLPAPGAVLLLIDLQRAIDHPSWGERNNPDAERQVGRLLAHWRCRGWPVWHVRHDSKNPASHYRPGQPGHAFKPETAPVAGELVIPKHTNSAFIGTDLEDRLRAGGLDALVVAGVITNNSVEATVRMAGNLGFQTWLVSDGCFTFARTDWNGAPRSADDVHAMSLANLDTEYCTVTTADALLGTVR
ncbi:cysteine hydrolase family protein [Pandoraea capi]|uniref:cysteine hydrolase family protein n=1 Tax=Pandoraea capi TaxID=2508286 RepID=UPI003CCCEC50